MQAGYDAGTNRQYDSNRSREHRRRVVKIDPVNKHGSETAEHANKSENRCRINLREKPHSSERSERYVEQIHCQTDKNE
jgi:hypothetical protein